MKNSKSYLIIELFLRTVIFSCIAFLIIMTALFISKQGTGTLSGTVTIGPNCPVERVGQTCPTPPEAYTSRGILVYKVNTEQLVAGTKFDATGHYRLELPPGVYTVVLDKTDFGSRADYLPAEVDIQAGQVTEFDINIDTGIR